MKRTYVTLVRAARSVLGVLGVLHLLDLLAHRSRAALWVRSWFSIYDLEDLLALDVPWWTFRSADEVEEFLRRRPCAAAFEWGSGASTAWLGRRAASVVSVEHDLAWADRMAPVLPDNARLVAVPPGPAWPGGIPSGKPGFADLDFTNYVDAIDEVPGPLDLIVIDGRAREACLDKAVDRLAPDGLIVLDNVDRARYRHAVAAQGDRIDVTWTRGLTPSLPYPTRTALISLRTG
ncbi:hypothetical protein FB382_002272 [Nocardioides ginsengisegetis]|uniref:Methyltransferase domain-containing protein n=1 Tax=Nocardioides ginsengisegetis TaxID=661491 RepID=A0A7W3PA00_9ACTN|nr:class I SAM-dependent methyltransferase [Nocardioides ginsengisegetis]MBA8803981.1 hypothetical protein [Nocardioides ginsengisegetis]